jgi:hypothetical protein
MKKSKKKISVFLVHQIEWMYDDEWYYRADEEESDEEKREINPSVKAFLSREKAEAYAKQLDRNERKKWEPHYLMGDMDSWDRISSLSEEEVLQRIEELGLEPPNDVYEIPEWWDPKMPKELSHQVWDLFDRLRFYEVLESKVDFEE